MRVMTCTLQGDKQMDREQDFLSEKEVEELRREVDALVADID